jgi:hypothetical protein
MRPCVDVTGQSQNDDLADVEFETNNNISNCVVQKEVGLANTPGNSRLHFRFRPEQYSVGIKSCSEFRHDCTELITKVGRCLRFSRSGLHSLHLANVIAIRCISFREFKSPVVLGDDEWNGVERRAAAFLSQTHSSDSHATRR